jgi:succinate-acetate transporter protein
VDLPHDGAGVASHTHVFLRPIASPLPLGLLALMCAGLLLSLESVGAFPASDSHTIGLILLGSSSRSSCSPRC